MSYKKSWIQDGQPFYVPTRDQPKAVTFRSS